MELAFDCFEVREDIAVVEFDVGNDEAPRTIVDELRALVEERGVVLVGLDDERGTAPEPRRDAEVPGARPR